MTPMGWGYIGYLVFFAILGVIMVYLVRRSGVRYIVCGRALPFIFVASSLLAQALDANCTEGNVSTIHGGGNFWIGLSYPLGLAICLIVVGIWYAKPLNRIKLLTLPDFYFRRFGTSVELIVGFLMMISFIILVAGNFAGSAWLVSSATPLSYGWALVAVATFIFLATVFGGLFSVVATDITQIYLAIAGFVGSAIFLFFAYGHGSWATFAANIPPGVFDFSGLYSIENGALIFWANIAALGIGDVIALDFMERMFAAESPETARKACWWGAFWTLVAGLAASFIGLMSFTIVKGFQGDPKDVLPIIGMQYVPFVLGLIMLSGVIGAGFSTANGGILATGTVLGRNFFMRHIYLPLWHRSRQRRGLPAEWGESEQKNVDLLLLIISRSMCIPVVAAAIWFAYVRPEPGMLLVLAFDVVFAGCFVPLTLGLFWKKANTPGALAGLITGSVLRLILYFTIPEHLAGLDTLIPPAVSAIVMVPVCLLTQKSHPPRHEMATYVPSEWEVVTTKM